MKRLRVKPKVWTTAFAVDGRWLHVTVRHAGRNDEYHRATVQEEKIAVTYRFKAARNAFTPYLAFRAAEKYLLEEVERTGEVEIEQESRPRFVGAACS